MRGFLSSLGALAIGAVIVVARVTDEATAQQGVAMPLATGCTNVVSTFPAGTPTGQLAAAVTPPGILVSIFRQDPAALSGFRGFAPNVPDFANDYRTTGSALEPIFICTTGPGTFSPPAAGGAPAASPTPTPTPTPAPTAAPFVAPTPAPTAPPMRTCCRVCTTGRACGDSCIAANLNCRVGPGCACNGRIVDDPILGPLVEVTPQDGPGYSLPLDEAIARGLWAGEPELMSADCPDDGSLVVGVE